MIESAADLDTLDYELCLRERAAGLPEGYYKFAPLIETPAALMCCAEIARTGGGRNIALVFGHGNLFRATGSRPSTTLTLDFPRNTVLMAARAAGILPVDTPYTVIKNQIGLELDASLAKTHGFTTKLCIHPTQVPIVKRSMQPSMDEIAWARKIEPARATG
jgi:citrate lyase subunit beta/citryl-CoA lyase